MCRQRGGSSEVRVYKATILLVQSNTGKFIKRSVNPTEFLTLIKYDQSSGRLNIRFYKCYPVRSVQVCPIDCVECRKVQMAKRLFCDVYLHFKIILSPVLHVQSQIIWTAYIYDLHLVGAIKIDDSNFVDRRVDIIYIF